MDAPVGRGACSTSLTGPESRRRLRHRHSPADRQRVAASRARLLLHPADVIARFWRMRGKEVFYPVGWDDNGLPTERRVQNYFGVRCDPSLPYDPGFTPPGPSGRGAAPRGQVPVSRRNFVELCRQLTEDDERAYAEAWRRLGLSVDWSLSYRTIDDGPQAISQRALPARPGPGRRLPGRGAVAVGRDVRHGGRAGRTRGPGGPGRLRPDRVPDRGRAAAGAGRAGGAVLVATTRPELLPACVALVAHPDDERYAGLFGATVRTPLFGVAVPVLAHRLADPAKGTGIAMVCTFGDATDVTWWRDLRLDTRPVIGKDGRLLDGPLPWLTDPGGQAAYQAAGGAAGAGGPGPDHRPAARLRGTARRARAGRARGEVLRVRRGAAGDRHHPAVVHQERRPGSRPARGAAGPRPRARLASPAHARPLRGLGERAGRRLADQQAALLRGAGPGVVPARRRRRACGTTPRSCRPTTCCRSIRRPTRRPGTSRASAAGPAGSPGTPT